MFSKGCVIVFALTATVNLSLNTPVAVAQQSGQRSIGGQPHVQVDLFRGLADIFSRGMDTLTDTLNRKGYNARVYSTGGWQLVARRIANDSARGQKDVVVLIGHSLGANATFDIASELNRQNIPIELIVTFDATRPQPVPKNVLHLVNFYQENGFGKRVAPGQGFQGELTNHDLTAETGLSHTTIEKSPRLHAMVMQKIADVVKKDLAKQLQPSKPKTKKRTPSTQTTRQTVDSTAVSESREPSSAYEGLRPVSKQRFAAERAAISAAADASNKTLQPRKVSQVRGDSTLRQQHI